MDIAVTSSAGTTKELWNTFASTFEKMSDFEIIDMDGQRIDKLLVKISEELKEEMED